MKAKPNSWQLLGQIVPLIDAMDDERAILSAQQVVSDRLASVQSARVDVKHPPSPRPYTRHKPKAEPVPPRITTPAAAGGADDPIAGPWRTAKEHMLVIARSGVYRVGKSAFESGLPKWIARLSKTGVEDTIDPVDRLMVARAMAQGKFNYDDGAVTAFVNGGVT
jgi:hypothetical protein